MNAFIGLLIWLRPAAVVDPPPAAVDVVVVVVAGKEELEVRPQTTSRLDLLVARTMRADSIFSTYARHASQLNRKFNRTYFYNAL